MQGAVGFLISTWLQIYQGIFQWKKILNRLGIDRIMIMSLWPRFFRPTLYTEVVSMHARRRSPIPVLTGSGVEWPNLGRSYN